jgi:CheY-like chemotaxis protein
MPHLPSPIQDAHYGAENRMRILVVDDEEGFLNILGDVLRDEGYEVALASDGKQAREALERESIDLIISDVSMPTLDGMRLHSYVREMSDNKEIPFVFISGYDDEHTRGLAQASSKDHFLSKTTPLDDIVRLIKKLTQATGRTA